MANTVAAGAIWGLLSDDFELLASVLANVFASKVREIIAGNHLVAQKGFEIAKEFSWFRVETSSTKQSRAQDAVKRQ